MNLLSLKEAAEILGYTERGLRKIVERSKAKSNGVRTHGPTIKFFQTEPSALIKFKIEWIEEFITDHTVDPSTCVAKSIKKIVHKSPLGTSTLGFGLDVSLMGNGH